MIQCHAFLLVNIHPSIVSLVKHFVTTGIHFAIPFQSFSGDRNKIAFVRSNHQTSYNLPQDQLAELGISGSTGSRPPPTRQINQSSIKLKDHTKPAQHYFTTTTTDTFLQPNKTGNDNNVRSNNDIAIITLRKGISSKIFIHLVNFFFPVGYNYFFFMCVCVCVFFLN